MESIDNHTAQTQLSYGRSAIIDVREPSEYIDRHIPGAINLPSTKYNKDEFPRSENLKICLVCETGSRAKQVGNKLEADGFSDVFILEQHMESIPRIYTTKGWTVDRQFRMTLGVLLAIFLILFALNVPYAFVIPFILCSGLVITSIIDKCYMRMGIAMLPWNKGKVVPK